jgi:hypothetical protein
MRRARVADDGHTSMRWDAGHGALVGHDLGDGVRVSLAIASLTIAVGDRALPLAGRTLEEARAWVGDALGGPAPTFRDYDMPAAPVRDGAPFAAPPAHTAELARWFGNAFALVGEIAGTRADAIEVACWPHHFDVGSIFVLDGDPRGRQIGFGVSPGDHFYEEPYLYLTPYPIPPKAALPALAAGGHWHRAGFTGAVLTATTIAAAGARQHALARAFFDRAIAAALAIIPPSRSS